MAFDIEQMKAALQFGGDRPSHFEVRMTIPGAGTGDGAASQELTFMAKAAQIPGMTLGVVQVPYFGVKVKVHGDRTWPEWTINIINDEDYLVRKAMERWSHRINTVRKNTVFNPFSANPATYKTDAYVYKYGQAGNLLRTYKLIGAWPTVVAPIDLSWDATDAIVEFPVTFAFDWMENDDNVLGGEGSGASNS